MKRIVQLAALVGVVLSLNSCGLPMAAARSVGSTVQSLGGLSGLAAASL